MDHDIQRQQLTRSFGIWSKSLQWLNSYLTCRTQSVYLNEQSTTPRNIMFGVSQGPCSARCCSRSIWPTSLTISYTTAVRTTRSYTSPVHRRKLHVLSLVYREYIIQWMAFNRLKINPTKSEVPVEIHRSPSPSRRQQFFPSRWLRRRIINIRAKSGCKLHRINEQGNPCQPSRQNVFLQTTSHAGLQTIDFNVNSIPVSSSNV